ncbi:MAG: L-lactate MFS transporter [Thermincolia bacterium]
MSVDFSRGWIVTSAGVGINLALGVLYTWSIFGKALTEELNWTATEASIPYTVAIAIFALMMVPAGRWQDKVGPRVVITVGGALTGLGMILAGFSQSLMALVLSFGVLAGTGIGLGYAAATPAAVKWFPPHKKGLITGLVVSGFGLASVYIAPLTNYLIKNFSVQQAFLYLGIGFFVVVIALAQLIQNPPAGYKVPGIAPSPTSAPSNSGKHDYEWSEMVKTPQFILLWIMFAFASSAGLMIIGHLAKIAKLQAGIAWGFYLVALLAIFNAAGRIMAGIVSDKIGRTRTMLLVFIIQAAVMAIFGNFSDQTSLAAGTAVVGFAYGACLSLFPSTTADFFGTKNLGVNYGLVFTAWGVGGVFGPIMAGKIADISGGNYTLAFQVAAVLCVIAAGLTFLTKPPKTYEATTPQIAKAKA